MVACSMPVLTQLIRRTSFQNWVGDSAWMLSTTTLSYRDTNPIEYVAQLVLRQIN